MNFKSKSGRPSALRAERRPVHRLDTFLLNDIAMKYFVDILISCIVRSLHGKTSLWTTS